MVQTTQNTQRSRDILIAAVLAQLLQSHIQGMGSLKGLYELSRKMNQLANDSEALTNYLERHSQGFEEAMADFNRTLRPYLELLLDPATGEEASKVLYDWAMQREKAEVVNG